MGLVLKEEYMIMALLVFWIKIEYNYLAYHIFY